MTNQATELPVNPHTAPPAEISPLDTGIFWQPGHIADAQSAYAEALEARRVYVKKWAAWRKVSIPMELDPDEETRCVSSDLEDATRDA
jgi:hypothetical protein